MGLCRWSGARTLGSVGSSSSARSRGGSPPRAGDTWKTNTSPSAASCTVATGSGACPCRNVTGHSTSKPSGPSVPSTCRRSSPSQCKSTSSACQEQMAGCCRTRSGMACVAECSPPKRGSLRTLGLGGPEANEAGNLRGGRALGIAPLWGVSFSFLAIAGRSGGGIQRTQSLPFCWAIHPLLLLPGKRPWAGRSRGRRCTPASCGGCAPRRACERRAAAAGWQVALAAAKFARLRTLD